MKDSFYRDRIDAKLDLCRLSGIVIFVVAIDVAIVITVTDIICLCTC